jgi:hypothetical protein
MFGSIDPHFWKDDFIMKKGKYKNKPEQTNAYKTMIKNVLMTVSDAGSHVLQNTSDQVLGCNMEHHFTSLWFKLRVTTHTPCL